MRYQEERCQYSQHQEELPISGQEIRGAGDDTLRSAPLRPVSVVQNGGEGSSKVEEAEKYITSGHPEDYRVQEREANPWGRQGGIELAQGRQARRGEEQ